jgi:type III restriction enzyme
MNRTHQYVADFIVRLLRSDGSILNLVLEVKGQEENVDRLKVTAACKWIDAVNNWGKLGKWAYRSVYNLTNLEDMLDSLI